MNLRFKWNMKPYVIGMLDRWFIWPRNWGFTLHVKRLVSRRFTWNFKHYFLWKILSTLVISNSKGLPEILRHIRTSTYQVCRIEEKLIRLTTFNKYICNWTLEVRDILKKLWKRAEILRSNFSSFPQYFSPVVRFSCLSRGKIFTSR